MLKMLFMLLCGHALSDFALQSDAMSKGKNRNRKPDYLPEGQKYTPCWPYWLSAHGLISGGLVLLITGSFFLGIVETLLHSLIDFVKCENFTSPHIDQLLHFICRLGYVAFWVFYMSEGNI